MSATTMTQDPENPAVDAPNIDDPNTWTLPPLEPLQSMAVNAAEGPILIVGGAGTGKTSAIGARAVALGKATGAPETVTVVCFNSRASRNLRHQMEQMIGAPPSRAGFHVATIHQLCSFMLRQVNISNLGISPNFSLWNETQTKDALAEIIDELGGDRTSKPSTLTDLISWYSLWRNHDYPSNDPPTDPKWWQYIEQYTEQKRLQNAVDFDDLIALTVQVMEENPAIRKMWNSHRTRHLLIDEFQDLTPLAYRLIRNLEGPTHSITVAMDPNQSIYNWRGADPSILESFIRDHPDFEHHLLMINHRSTAQLVRASIAVQQHPLLSALSPDRQTPMRAAGSDIRYIEAHGPPPLLYDAICAEIRRLVKEDEIPYHNIALIYPQHHSRRGLITLMENQAIPYVTLGNVKQHADPDVTSVLSILTLVTNPHNATAFRAAADPNIFKQHRNFNPTLTQTLQDIAHNNQVDLIQAAEALAKHMPAGHNTQQKLDYLVNLWRHLRDNVDRQQLSPLEMINLTYNRMCQAATGFETTTPTPAITKLMVIAERYHHPVQADASSVLTGFLEYIASSEHPDLVDDDNADPLAYQTGVTLATIHSAKGMQFHTAFLLDLVDNIIPGKYYDPARTSGAEKQRLFYTAITRATDLLYLCWATYDHQNSPTQASRFIDALRPAST